MTIFFANLSEISRALVRFMKKTDVEAEISEDHDLCDRFLFSLPDNSLLVSPRPLDPEFISDTLTLLNLKNISFLSPRPIGESLSTSVLEDPDCYQKLTKVISDNPNSKLLSYAATPEFYQLTDKLKADSLSFNTPELPGYSTRWTAEFFGSKCGFRQAAGSLGSPFPRIPAGVICASLAEVSGWASKYLSDYGGFVLKTNHGLAGAGLKIAHQSDLEGQRPEDFLRSLLNSERFWQDFPLVVEAFVPPDMTVAGGAPNIELQIADGKITPLYVCGMRISKEGVFQGVEFGSGAVSNELASNLELAGRQYGEKLLSSGYNGFFEIDFVFGLDQVLYPIESNLRRTGGTHAFELAVRLLGPTALSKSYFVTNNRFFSESLKGQTYIDLKAKLANYLYPIENSNRGVVLTIVTSLTHGRLGYVVIDNDQDSARSLEKDFLLALA